MAWCATVSFAALALLCASVGSSRGQPPQQNYFAQFDVGWEDSCPVVDDDSWCKFTIRITGKIMPGTTARFAKALAHARGREPLLINLDSLGGDLTSAMKIGRLLRKSRGRTSVEKDASCASACVLIFAAGLSRIVDAPNTERPAPWTYAVGFPSPTEFDPSKPFDRSD
jgi:membrane-bound ClpP family serine protease